MQVFESWNQVYSTRNEKVRKNFHPNCGSLLYRDRLLSDRRRKSDCYKPSMENKHRCLEIVQRQLKDVAHKRWVIYHLSKE